MVLLLAKSKSGYSKIGNGKMEYNMGILDIFKKRKTDGQVTSDVANTVANDITPRPVVPQGVTPRLADTVTAPPQSDATRPRIVPNMPVNEDTGYSESAPVNVYPTPSQTTQDEINNIQTKDYSIQKDANGNIIHRGKDRDAKWSLKDKIGSTLLGVLSGAGGGPIGMLTNGLNAGMNRNYLEQRSDSQELGRLIPRLKEQQEAEGFDTQQAFRQAQINGSVSRADQAETRLNETLRNNADLRYDRGFRQALNQIKLGYQRGQSPELDAKLARYGIDIQSWNPNKKQFWQGQNLMQLNPSGEAVPVTDAKGQPVIDETRTPVTIDIGGQKFTVSQTVGANATAQAIRSNTGYENQDIADENRYNTSEDKRVQGNVDDATEANEILNRSRQLLQEAAVLDSQGQTEEATKKRDQSNQLLAQGTAKLKSASLSSSAPAPQKRKRVPVPKIVPRRGGGYTDSDIQRIIHQ